MHDDSKDDETILFGWRGADEGSEAVKNRLTGANGPGPS